MDRNAKVSFDDRGNQCSFCARVRALRIIGEDTENGTRGHMIKRNKTHCLNISFRYTRKISGKIPLSDYRARERRYIFHGMHFKVLPTRIPYGVPYRTDCRIGYSEHPFHSPFQKIISSSSFSFSPAAFRLAVIINSQPRE